MHPSERAAPPAWPVRAALRCAAFAERWFPDAYVFAVLGVVLVAACTLATGAEAKTTAATFGEGFWSLIPSPCRWPSWSSAATWWRRRR